MDLTATLGYITVAVLLSTTSSIIIIAIMNRITKAFVWLSIYAAFTALVYGNVFMFLLLTALHGSSLLIFTSHTWL